jgi:hypothetical protein
MYKLVIASLLGYTKAFNTQPGLGASVDELGLNTAKNIVSPYIFANIKDILIPELDFDGGNLKNIDIKIPVPSSYENIQLLLDDSSSGIELIAN